MTIDLCRPEDLPAILPLLGQLWPGSAIDPDRARQIFQRVLGSADQLYVCARSEGKIVGFASLTVKNNLWPAGPGANVDELVVDAAHRGQGIGRALIEHLAAAARACGG